MSSCAKGTVSASHAHQIELLRPEDLFCKLNTQRDEPRVTQRAFPSLKDHNPGMIQLQPCNHLDMLRIEDYNPGMMQLQPCNPLDMLRIAKRL